jgi:anti-sigma factor RsiW
MTKTEYCVSAEDVMALLDGELSAADARTISAHVEECSECALVVEQLRGVSQALSTWNVPEVSMAVDEFVEEQVEKLHSRRSMMRVRFSPRNLFAVGGSVAGALVMFLLAAVLARPHGQLARMSVTAPTTEERQYAPPPARSDHIVPEAASHASLDAVSMRALASFEDRSPTTTAPMIARRCR